MTRCTRSGMARTLLRAAACAALLGGAPLGAPGFMPGFMAAAQAQSGTATLDDFSVKFGTTIVKVPRIEARGTALSAADLKAVLDPDGAEPWATRLKRLSADSLAIPLLRVEQAMGDKVQVVVYREIVARHVVEGRIGSLEATGAVLTVEGGGPGSGTGAYGKLTASDLDLTGLARLMTERGGPDAAPIRVYGAFGVDDIAFSGGEGQTVRIGRLEGRDFGGRPTATPWGEAAANLAAGPPKSDSPEENARLAGLGADILDSVMVGRLDLRDLSVTDPGGGKPTRFTLAHLGYGTEGGTGSVSTEGMAVDGPALRMGLAKLTLSGLSLKPTLEGLRRFAAGAFDPAQMRRYAPLVGRVAIEGLDLHVLPGPAADPAKADAPVDVVLRSVGLDLSAVRDGVPTAARLALDGLSFPVHGDDPTFAELVALGYKAVDLSGVLDSSWNEESREVAVRELSLVGKEMGSARLSATLGGIGPDVFNPDVAVSSLALLSASAKALALTVENNGLFERIVAEQAKTQSLKPEELLREYSAGALLGIPAVLGNSPSAKALGQAVARFVTKPGRLTVTAAAKDPAGLGFLDVSTAQSPGRVFEKLNVTATAE